MWNLPRPNHGLKPRLACRFLHWVEGAGENTGSGALEDGDFLAGRNLDIDGWLACEL